MLGKVGREIGPHLRRGQLVLSVLAGATTAALTGILGHDQVVRSMPNTPARLGKGMTVWYATPETTEAQRAQAAALLGALGAQLEVDDEKMVAMATAVSGTGPTYVFLVMEALIDAAVHLGFPRHIAHDLVIETLEGSTLFAKQSGMHPAELRNMVTSPGGTSAAALHELESGRLRTVLSEAVWAAFRRTVELGDQLEAVGVRSPRRGSAEVHERGRDHAIASDLRRAPLADLRAVDLRAPERDLWADEAALWDRLVGLVGRPRRRGLAPAGRRAIRRRRPGLVARRARRPHRRLAGARDRLHRDGDRDRRWPTDERLRRRRLRHASTSACASRGRRCRATRSSRASPHRAPRPARASAHRLSPAEIRGDDAWGWVYLTLHGHYLDHLGGHRAVDRRAPRPPGRRRPVRRRTPARPTRPSSAAQDAAIAADLEALLAAVPPERLDARST